jgi:hypothetical protein
MKPKYSLRPYQRDDLAFAIANPKSLNLSDPGTGKTGVVCVLAYYYWLKKQKRTFWAMPKSLLKKNKDEFGLFTDFVPDDIMILESDFAPLTKGWSGPTMTRIKKRRSMMFTLPDGTKSHTLEHPDSLFFISAPLKSEQGPGWQILGTRDPVREKPKNAVHVRPILDPYGNPQFKVLEEPEVVKDLIQAAREADAKVLCFTFAFLRNHWARLLEVFDDAGLMMVDELHMGYKTAESAQTASLYEVTRKLEGFIGMTGTLIDGRLDSAFPAVHIIEPRYYGSYGGFLDHHAGYIDDYGKVQYWTNFDKLKSILARHAIRHSFEEVYGDEPVHFETKMVDMSSECRAKYDEFHELAMLELEDDIILDGSLPGVNVIRARQIMAHPETMGIAKGELTGKDAVIAGYANEGRPMLVFAALKPEQVRIAELLRGEGLRVGLINSDVSAKQRDVVDQQFKAGELDAIVGSGPTVAVGYNWERADHVVFASIDYQDTNIKQAYRRASRGTRKTVLRVTYLQYNNSIDQRMYAIAMGKSELAHSIDETQHLLEMSSV